ncbi:CD5 antigen-like [Aplochiton taeniatus]
MAPLSKLLMVLFWSTESVRLVNGSGLCSGRVEVKSDQLWVSVCEADFDQQDAEVVCRESGCGAPSALQGALYGEVEAPVWTKEFQCEGSESRLLDCVTSDSARDTCSPGKAVGLTCSEPDDVRLVEGGRRCAGRLEMNHQGEWRPLVHLSSLWSLKSAAVVCRQLDCGSAVSTEWISGSTKQPVWVFNSQCAGSESALRECGAVRIGNTDSDSKEVICSESVRLVNGSGLCSGRVEVKSDQLWASVCEADFDRQDAEVVCRESGCGAPSALQGALYGEVEAPVWTKEFQCEGSESRLLDCVTSDSARDTCSPGKAVGLTCSEPDDVRLVEGGSRCAGRLEMNHQGEWRPLVYKSSDLLLQANISHYSSMSGSEGHQQGLQVFLGYSFTITCSIQPQYPGGSFHLTFTGTNRTHTQSQTAVNHSANFLFPAADHAHQGNYSCVYHIYVFSHNFSSESEPLSLTVSASPLTALIIRVVVVLTVLLVSNTALYLYFKTTRGRKPGHKNPIYENIELVSLSTTNEAGRRGERGPGHRVGSPRCSSPTSRWTVLLSQSNIQR